MEAFKTLKSGCVPYSNFDNLPIGEHSIHKFSIVSMENGDQKTKRLRLDLADCYVYLPERFAMTPEKCDELNRGKYVMIFNGKDAAHKNRLDEKNSIYF